MNKSFAITCLDRPLWGFRSLRFPEFLYVLQRLGWPQGHSVAGRNKSMKKFKWPPSGNESAIYRLVAQCHKPTTPLRAATDIWTVKVKVNQTHYMPGQALSVLGDCGAQVSRQSAHEGGKVVSPKHRPSLTPRKYPWYSFLLGAESTPGP